MAAFLEADQELARLARRASGMRGGPRVLILPGIMGSTIGRRRKDGSDDVTWFDPLEIAQGQLVKLALPGGNRYGNPYYDSSNNYNSYNSQGKHSGHSSGRNYAINPLDDGAFEVVSSNPFCTVRFNRHGEPKHYSDECTPEQRRESYEYAQRNR